MQNQFPSHRQFYTRLIDAIAQRQQSWPHADYDATSNLLSSGPSPSPLADGRALLLTLHVLFPNLVLSALDLLDRGLVTCHVAPEDRDKRQSESVIEIGKQGGHSDEHGDDDKARHYLVQSTITHRRRDAKPISKRYLVHTRAWNCSCPAFALDAYHHQPPHKAKDALSSAEAEVHEATGLDFGGLSLDGMSTAAAWDDVPCCKHLLACFLAERWEGVLGRHVETVMATKEEMAAVVASL